MDPFQICIITLLIIGCIGLVLYGFYAFLKIQEEQETEPILTNLMEYKPPSIN